jgi:hypothetical protein
MKNNFKEWYNAYYLILIPYYNSFCTLFENSEKPTITDFIYYCFINTSQTYNRFKNIKEAYIPSNNLI